MSVLTKLAVEIADGLEFTDFTSGVSPALVRNIVAATLTELEQRWELIEKHTLMVDEPGEWVIQHPIIERPNLLECPLNGYREFFPEKRGKYLVWLDIVDTDGILELFAKAVE